MMDFDSLGFEILTVVVVTLFLLSMVFAWKSTGRSPLDYDIYMVETQTNHVRTIIQVVHLGYEERRLAGSDLIRRMQSARVYPHVQDMNVVIQSPSTIVDSPRRTLTERQLHSVRLWQMEIVGDAAHQWENTAMAAAAAIAISSGRTQITIGNDRHFELRNFVMEPQETPAVETVEEAVEVREEESPPETDAAPPPLPDASDEPPVAIRLKFLDDTERHVDSPLTVTLADFKRTHLGDLFGNLRLIFRGELLRDDQRTLRECGLHDSCVVHVLLSPHAREAAPPVAEEAEEGSLMHQYVAALAMVAINALDHAASAVAEVARWAHSVGILRSPLGNMASEGTYIWTIRRWLSTISWRDSRLFFRRFMPSLFMFQVCFLWVASFLFPKFFDRSTFSLLTLITFFVLYANVRSRFVLMRG